MQFTVRRSNEMDSERERGGGWTEGLSADLKQIDHLNDFEHLTGNLLEHAFLDVAPDRSHEGHDPFVDENAQGRLGKDGVLREHQMTPNGCGNTASQIPVATRR